MQSRSRTHSTLPSQGPHPRGAERGRAQLCAHPSSCGSLLPALSWEQGLRAPRPFPEQGWGPAGAGEEWGSPSPCPVAQLCSWELQLSWVTLTHTPRANNEELEWTHLWCFRHTLNGQSGLWRRPGVLPTPAQQSLLHLQPQAHPRALEDSFGGFLWRMCFSR